MSCFLQFPGPVHIIKPHSNTHPTDSTFQPSWKNQQVQHMLCFGAGLRCLFQQGDVEACWEIARSSGEVCEVMYCTESALKEWPGKEETTDPVTFNVKSVASRQQHTSLKHWYTPARGSQRGKYLSKQQIQYTDPSGALSTARHKNPVSCWLLTPYWWIHSGQNGCKKKLQLGVHTSLR